MAKDGLQRILDVLDLLRERNIDYRIDQQQPEAIMVTIALVGVRVEVEFFVDHLEFSTFRGSEDVDSDEAALIALLEQHSG
jgi:hypothetical protein